MFLTHSLLYGVMNSLTQIYNPILNYACEKIHAENVYSKCSPSASKNHLHFLSVPRMEEYGRNSLRRRPIYLIFVTEISDFFFKLIYIPLFAFLGSYS